MGLPCEAEAYITSGISNAMLPDMTPPNMPIVICAIIKRAHYHRHH